MAQEQVFKVVLSTKKEVLLREPKIKDQELALEIASSRSKNEMMTGVHAQKELLKMLIVSINGHKPDKIKIEDLDALFSYREYMQLQKVLGEISGGSDLGEYQTEIVTSGGK